MAWIVTKYFLTAAVVVLVSELAKRSDKLGGLIAALPMVLVFPVLLPRIGFWPALLACVLMTVVCFALFALVMRRFGVELL
jgi:hypothetical protein